MDRALKPNERKVRANVPTELNAEALKAGDDELAKNLEEIAALEQQAKDAAAGFRQSIKALKARDKTLLEERRTGKRMVESDCVEVTYFPTHKATYYPHPDHPNFVKISEAPLSAEEIRGGEGAPLFDAAEKKGKAPKAPKGPKTKKPGAAAPH